MLDHATSKRNISANVTRLLRERGMSQAELARATGDNTAYISRICTGQIEPTASGAMRIATGLGTTVEDLLQVPSKIF